MVKIGFIPLSKRVQKPVVNRPVLSANRTVLPYRKMDVLGRRSDGILVSNFSDKEEKPHGMLNPSRPRIFKGKTNASPKRFEGIEIEDELNYFYETASPIYLLEMMYEFLSIAIQGEPEEMPVQSPFQRYNMRELAMHNARARK